MARAKSLKAMLREQEPKMRKAFLAAIRQMRGDISAAEVARALQRGDIDGAITALRLDDDALDALSETLRTIYLAGGNNAVLALPAVRTATGARVPIRFGGHDPITAREIAEHSSLLIKEILEPAREAARVIMTDGYIAGRNPTRTANEIIGKIGPTGRRTGGIIGLHSDQIATVRSMRDALTSPHGVGIVGFDQDGKPIRKFWIGRDGTLKSSFGKRDKSLDRYIKAAIEGGKKLPADQVDHMAARYSDRLLKVRGDRIARTETLWAMRSAKYETMRQQIDSGKIDAAAVTVTWDASGDGRVRDSHAAMDGQVVPWGTPFRTPTGYQMRFPGDSSLGAPGSETINCFPANQPINLVGIEAAVSSTYCGEIVEIFGGNGVNFSVTPNHPVLTQRGWVAAGLVKEGDELVYSRVCDFRGASAEPDVGNRYASAQQIHDAAKVCGRARRAARGVVNFHGHVPSHDVDVVTIPWHLRSAFNSATAKVFGDEALAETDIASTGQRAFGILLHGTSRAPRGSDCSVRRFGSAASVFLGHLRGGPPVAVGDAGTFDAEVTKATIDRASRDADDGCHSENRFARMIESFDLWKVIGAQCLIAVRSHFAFAFGGILSRDRAEAKIRKATDRFGLAHTYAARNGSDRLARRMATLDLWEKLFTGISVAFFGAFPRPASDVSAPDRSIGDGVGNTGFPGRVGNSAAGTIGGSDSRVPVFSAVKVSKVQRHDYDGPVFDFQSSTGMLLASGFVVHNCRCTAPENIDFFRGLT